jgi:hypothetical protein
MLAEKKAGTACLSAGVSGTAAAAGAPRNGGYRTPRYLPVMLRRRRSSASHGSLSSES